jgi:hypothetical protein
MDGDEAAEKIRVNYEKSNQQTPYMVLLSGD